jgi:hypothetical protein
MEARRYGYPVEGASSLSKMESHVWVRWVEKWDGLMEGVRPVACGNRGSEFSMWNQYGMKIAPCTDGYHSK